MNRLFAFTALAALITPAGATELRYYNDAQGLPEGSSMTFGDMTFYNDANGTPAGSAQRFGNTSYYNDAQGRPAGSRMDFGGDE